MNGICPIIDCFFGAIRDGEDGYLAVQVYRDGNQINLGHFDDLDNAEDFAAAERERQVAQHSQFGVGA